MGLRTNQLNYVDWRHAKEVNTRNTDAEYLYAELVKRNIPAVIMEPLLGGRLSRLNDHLMARLKQRRPQESVASWAFRFAGTFPDVLTVLSGMTYMEHLQDNLRTFSRLFHVRKRSLPTGRYRPANAAIPHRAVQRLQILYAVPLWTGYSSHPAALQPLHQRGQRAAEQPRRELPRGRAAPDRRL